MTRVFRSSGGVLSEADYFVLTGVSGLNGSCSLAWADCDNDGDLDLALAGWTGSERIARVHHNSDGVLSDTDFLALAGVSGCSLAWGDYDNDGDLDLVLAGESADGHITRIYRNSDGVLSDTDYAALTGVSRCSLAWGDYDNDGDIDLALAGESADYGHIARVYRNSDGVLSDTDYIGLTGVRDCSLAWGDYDADGDLDLALAGEEGVDENYVTRIYRNNCSARNTPPGAPTGLAAAPDAAGTVLSWDEASDHETPAAGLSYNLRVVDTSDGSEVFPSMADAADGRRRIPALGMVRPGPSSATWTLKLPQGGYTFQVQAIDSGLQGGAWSEPVGFTVLP